MQVLVCNGQWVISGNAPTCSGTLTTVSTDQLPGNGMTTEEAVELHEHALLLFAVVFGILAIKKALNI
jgi:hypothetical protein